VEILEMDLVSFLEPAREPRAIFEAPLVVPDDDTLPPRPRVLVRMVVGEMDEKGDAQPCREGRCDRSEINENALPGPQKMIRGEVINIPHDSSIETRFAEDRMVNAALLVAAAPR
jgi:hypothetical protein